MPNAEATPSHTPRIRMRQRLQNPAKKSAPESPTLWVTAQKVARYPHPVYWFEPKSKRLARGITGWAGVAFGAIGAGFILAQPSPELSPAWSFDGLVIVIGLFLAATASRSVLYFWLDRILDGIRHWGGIVATWAGVSVLVSSWIFLGQVDYAHFPSRSSTAFQELLRDELVTIGIGVCGTALGLLGSWSAGSFVNVRRERTTYLRRRTAGRVVLIGVVSNAAQATLFILTSLEDSARPLALSLLLAVFLGANKWQWQRLADNDKTKDRLRTIARRAHAAFLLWDEDASAGTSAAQSAQRAALSTLGDLSDALKVGNIEPIGSRMADSGTLIVLEFLQEALSLRASMEKHYQGMAETRYPDPLQGFQEMPPAGLRGAATSYLQRLFDCIEGTRYIRRPATPRPSDSRLDAPSSDVSNGCRRYI